MRLLLATLAAFLIAPAAASAAGESSIFYYPWWGTKQQDGRYLHWNQRGHAPPSDLATTYFPARGAYSSSDVRVLRAQMEEMKAAGITEVVSSWWGWGSTEDLRLPKVLREAKARGLKVAVQIEPYGSWERTPETLASDLVHLQNAGITRAYVYQPFDDLIDIDAWAKLNRDAPTIEMLAQTTDVTKAAAAGFDGVYTYDVFGIRGGAFAGLCDRAHALDLICAPSVGPGYNAWRATGDERVRIRRQGATYDGMWRAAIAAAPDRITITSYNEWHEGTQIEPARRHPPSWYGAYESYEGAYGQEGTAAESAYIVRTAYWTTVYRVAAAAARALEVLRSL